MGLESLQNYSSIQYHLYNHNLFGKVAFGIIKLLNLMHLKFARRYWNFQWDWVL